MRRRMIEDMTIRKLVPKTQASYIRAVRNYTVFLGRSPDPIGLARIVQPLGQPLDDPGALHDLAQEHGPRFLGQPLGSGFDAKGLVERGTEQR